jgi:hypothetical protein
MTVCWTSARQTAMLEGSKTYVGKPCKRGHDGARYTTSTSCLGCMLERRAALRKLNSARKPKRNRSTEYKARETARRREKYQTDPEYRKQILERQRELNKSPERMAKRESWRLQHYYGVTKAKYDEMLLSQAGVCKICGSPRSTSHKLAVDHCHETGAVRGLLCLNCNQALGKFKEDPALLDSAASYLRSAQAAAQQSPKAA